MCAMQTGTASVVWSLCLPERELAETSCVSETELSTPTALDAFPKPVEKNKKKEY